MINSLLLLLLLLLPLGGAPQSTQQWTSTMDGSQKARLEEEDLPQQWNSIPV